ncbi:MAG: tRNA pseudouridine(55) synthase TruB [Dorea sp.]|nr:tRNA pseudouridine(55) synthase TruB [Dorea sp.]
MIHGIINVKKEKGFTSHDVVAKLRRITKQKKIGHTGTLDPDATGVLPVCLGKGTRLVDMITDKEKTYEAVMLLGMTTDTQDTSGEVLERRSTEDLTEDGVLSVIASFIGDYQQIPPMYSALKVNGRKLYELAREGITVERKARDVKILDIRVLEVDLPRVRMEVSCSKGTYIRTLCYDIGEKLGCGGCMEELIRTKVGIFELKDSFTLDEIQTLMDQGMIQKAVKSIDDMFPDYPKVRVREEFEYLILNGNEIPAEAIREEVVFNKKNPERLLRVYKNDGAFVAVYKKGKNKLRVRKMFYSEN